MKLERPRSVRVGSTLLAVGSAVGVAAVVALWSSSTQVADARRSGRFSAEELQTVQLIQDALRYQLVVAAMTALVLGVLAAAARRPFRLVRSAVWVCAVMLAAAWSCGVAESIETYTQRQLTDPIAVREAFAALLPSWYPAAISLSTAALLGLMTAASVVLLRMSAVDFYRMRDTAGGPRALYTFARQPDSDGPPAS